METPQYWVLTLNSPAILAVSWIILSYCVSLFG